MCDQSGEQTRVINLSPVSDGLDFHSTAESTNHFGRTPSGARLPTAVNTRDLTQLGGYRLLRKLGEGGMGAVYLGEQSETGLRAAIKVLPQEVLPDEHSYRRFAKEARLLAEVRHPNVTNLLEYGKDGETCYLAMELVEGIDLKHFIAFNGPLNEQLALELVRDVAGALAAAHRRGIVHRDIKPGNVLLAVEGVMADPESGVAPEEVCRAVAAGARPIVKLSDFGLARHTEQTASMEMTRTGAMLGTPYYIAPEQCAGKGEVGPAADVYSLGATLFEMLAGRPPFKAADPVKLISLHCFEQAPDLRKLNPNVSDGAARLVAKSLSKSPDARQANAEHLLAEIDRLLSGVATDACLHPIVPKSGGNICEAVWTWELEGDAAKLWPLVSNTDRVNAAMGLPAVEYTTDRDENGALRKHGEFRLGPAKLRWQEHPFEWVEGRRLGVLREFRKGPFAWFLSVVELTPRATGGCTLTHTARIATRGLFGKLFANFELNVKGSKGLDKIYRRMDAVVSGRLKGSADIDPFRPNDRLNTSTTKRFAIRQQQLEESQADCEGAELLVRHLAESPAAELARIRPHVLARRLGVPAATMTETCLRACHVGLLELHWDILCPTCRISSSVKDTLAAIDAHSYCEACDLDFQVDFGNAVELIFRVHPELRQAELKTYCAGGPEHAPHVIAQARIEAGEALELDVTLDAGSYGLRGPQLPYSIPLSVEMNRGVESHLVRIEAGEKTLSQPSLRAGRQILTLENHYPHRMLVRLERTIVRKDVVTAAAASKIPLFQELFPGERLSREQLSDVSTCALVAVRIADPAAVFRTFGDGIGFQKIQERMRQTQAAIDAAGGQVINRQSDGLLASFNVTVDAVATALKLGESPEEPRVRVAVHRGAALTTSIDGRTDLYGGTVAAAASLLDRNPSQSIVISEELRADAEVQAFLIGIGTVAPVASNEAQSSMSAAPEAEALS